MPNITLHVNTESVKGSLIIVRDVKVVNYSSAATPCLFPVPAKISKDLWPDLSCFHTCTANLNFEAACVNANVWIRFYPATPWYKVCVMYD